MKFKLSYIVVSLVILVLLLLVFRIRSASQSPVAVIRVVDGAGKPIAGAVIRSSGLRTKAGPYSSGWYGWGGNARKLNPLIRTDETGAALVPYPKYVFEKIETGQLCLYVQHSDYVAASPEPHVATTPPAGAPWSAWFRYFKDAAVKGSLFARADPIVLKKGATLKVSVRPDSEGPKDQPLFVQVASLDMSSTNNWAHPKPNVAITHQLAAGSQTVRATALDKDGKVWFSDVIDLTVAQDKTNELEVILKPGVTLRGKLDDTVPRPVRNGRVSLEVSPVGHSRQSSPPQWHAWSNVREDGTFEIDSLPTGMLEISALCQGFVSTNGPGQFHMGYPQTNVIGRDGLSITIGMEPTTRLEVQVSDDKGDPLPNTDVVTWPNIRYGEWSATILMSDLYNTKEVLAAKANTPPSIPSWAQQVPDFIARTDKSGLAVFSNLPVMVEEFTVNHSNYVVAAVKGSSGQQRREVALKLVAGETNHASVQLERKDQRPIAHY